MAKVLDLETKMCTDFGPAKKPRITMYRWHWRGPGRWKRLLRKPFKRLFYWVVLPGGMTGTGLGSNRVKEKDEHQETGSENIAEQEAE